MATETLPSDKIVEDPKNGIPFEELSGQGLKKNAVTQVRPRSRPKHRFQSLDSRLSRNPRTYPSKRRCDSETSRLNYEVRFTLPDLKAYIDRVWNCCMPDSHECPAIKERLERHRQKYHPDKNTTQQLSVSNCNIAVGPSFMELATLNKFKNHYAKPGLLPEKSKQCFAPKRGQTDPFGLNNRYSNINKSLHSSACKKSCRFTEGRRKSGDNDGYGSKYYEINVNNKENSNNMNTTGFNYGHDSKTNEMDNMRFNNDYGRNIIHNNETNTNINDSGATSSHNNNLINDMNESNQNMDKSVNNFSNRNIKTETICMGERGNCGKRYISRSNTNFYTNHKSERNSNIKRKFNNSNIKTETNYKSERNYDNSMNNNNKNIVENIKNENERNFSNDRGFFNRNNNNNKPFDTNNDRNYRYTSSYNDGISGNRFSNVNNNKNNYGHTNNYRTYSNGYLNNDRMNSSYNNGMRVDYHDGLRNISDGYNNQNISNSTDLGINTKCTIYNPCRNSKRNSTDTPGISFTPSNYQNVRSTPTKCCTKTAMTLPSEICHAERNPDCPIKVCSKVNQHFAPKNRFNEMQTAECPQCDNNSNNSKIIIKNITDKNICKPELYPTGSISIICSSTKPYKSPNVYETYLHQEVNDWLKKVPFDPNYNPCAKQDRQTIIDNMVERLKSLVERVDDDNYIELVKVEINKCIDNLNIWYPGARRDQSDWRDRICESLLNSIREINQLLLRDKKCGGVQEHLKQFCTDKFTTVEKIGVGCSNCTDVCDEDMMKNGKAGHYKKPCKTCKFKLEEEIQIWMTKSHILQPFDVISKKDLKTLLANKVSPYLFKTYNPVDRLQIKSQIVNTLQSLPICINSMCNHKLNTIKYANDLTDRLLVFQTNLEQKNRKCKPSVCLEPCDANCLSMSEIRSDNYSDDTKTNKRKEFAVGNNLTDFLIEEIKFCLQDTAFENDKFIAKSSLDIIMKNIEEIKDGNDNRAKVELFYLLHHTGKLTIAETLDLVKYIMRTIMDVLNLKISPNSNSNANKFDNPFYVFTCHQRASAYNNMRLPMTLLTATCSTPYLSQEKENYYNNVSDMIKEWLISIDYESLNLADANKTFLANELTNNILEKSKLEHIKPHLTISDQQKMWRVFIYKWLNKHKIYDHLNAVNVKVSVLIRRLKDVISRNYIENRVSKYYSNIMETDNFGPNFINKSFAVTEPQFKDRTKIEVNKYLKRQFVNTNKDSDAVNYLIGEFNKLENDKAKSSDYVVNFELQTKSDSALSVKRSNRNMRSQTNASEDVKDVILKYIDHSDSIIDPVARKAAVLLLVRKLQKLSQTIITDLFERENVNFSIPILEQELRYIAVISDWLKLMIILCDFNEVGSMERITFVNSLASKIYKLEASRPFQPYDSNHYDSLVSVIIDSLCILPLPPDGKPNISQRAHELATIIFNLNNVPLRYNRETQAFTSPEQNLCEFLEDDFRFNSNDLYNDHLKLDSVAKRIINELKLVDGSESSTNNQMNNFLIINPVKRIETELYYSKEISEWIKNLPIPEKNTDIKVEMISDLAERIYLRDIKKAAKDKNADRDLGRYIDDWINSLPLEKVIDISVATQQLRRRIESVKQKDKRSKSLPPLGSGNKWYNKIFLCRKRNKHSKQDHIVNVIEEECNNLSLKGNKTTVKKLKLELASNLFQTINELNSNPVVFNNDDLYKTTLSEDLDKQLNNILPGNISQSEKNKLKTNLLDGIMAAKSVNKDVNAGHLYEQRLEQTIETSMPHPVQEPIADDPGFEIYKHRLAEMFIADNFDHSDPAVKLKYQKQIQKEIDKYFADAQKRNAIPLSRDQLQNELYSTLFRVTIPNDDAICDEVEEIKTRSEVDQWLNELPLREPHGMGELLEWDQILTALTRKIYYMEKSNPPDLERKFHDEILKWLLKLPLLPGAHVNILVSRLIDRLNATKNDRKCVKASETTPTVESVSSKHSTSKISNDSRKRWSLPPHFKSTMTEYKSIDLLIDTVENWANQLPLTAYTQADEDNNNILRDVVTTNIIMKVSEFNSKSEIFDDYNVFYNLVVQEINNTLINLPQTDELVQTKNERVFALTQAIMNLRPNVLEDKNKHQYRDELLYVLINTLKQCIPKNRSDKVIIDKINDEIIDNFLEYKHGYRDDTSRVYYKSKIDKAVMEYLQQFKTNENTKEDPLIKANEVITELSKVHPINPLTIVEDIQMNRMKNEVKVFTRPFVLEETDLVRNIQNELTKDLYEKEKFGHTPEIEQAMRVDIENAMKSLGKANDCNELEIFMKRLRDNETARNLVLPKLLGNSPSNRDLGPVRKTSPTTSFISYVNGSDFNSAGFSGGTASVDQASTNARQTVVNQTPEAFIPFDHLNSSTYPSLGNPGFDASIQGAQLNLSGNTARSECCQPVMPPCCQPVVPPCCHQDLGVQVNQDTSTQHTSTDWFSMHQGTRIENLPGFQNLSLSQPNTSYLDPRLNYSGFTDTGSIGLSPMTTIPPPPQFQKYNRFQDTVDLPMYSWLNTIVEPHSTEVQNPMMQVAHPPQQINNYTQWQEPGNIQNLPALPSTGQSSGPSRNGNGISYSGFSGGVQANSTNIQTEPLYQSSVGPYSGFGAGGIVASTPRQNTLSYSDFAGGIPVSSSPIHGNLNQNNTIPYSNFAQGVPIASTPRQTGVSFDSSSVQYVPPTGPPWISIGDTMQSKPNTSLGYNSAGQVPMNLAQYSSQLQNRVAPQEPRYYEEGSINQAVQTPPQPANADESQWFTLETGTPVQMQGYTKQMKQEPSTPYYGANGTSVQYVPPTGNPWISIDSTGYSGFADGAQVASSAISQQNQTPQGVQTPNVEESQWFSMERGTPLQMQGTPVQMQDPSMQMQGNLQGQMQGSSIPTGQYIPVSYPPYNQGSSPAQYLSQNTGGSMAPVQSYQPPNESQWLTLEENTRQYPPNFQNEPSQRNVTFANDAEQSLDYSEFFRDVPATSSPRGSLISPLMGENLGENLQNVTSNGTQWLTLEQATPVQMKGPSIQTQGPFRQESSIQGPLMQGSSIQGQYMQRPMQGMSKSLPTGQSAPITYPGFTGQSTSLPINSGQYSQMQNQGARNISGGLSNQAPQFYVDASQSQTPGGTVLPWTTQSTLGSVQRPSQQAIALIHGPPDTQIPIYSNSQQAQNALPRFVVSPPNSASPYPQLFQGVSPNLRGQYLSPYQNQMPNFELKASMPQYFSNQGNFDSRTMPNQYTSYQNQPFGPAMSHSGRHENKVSFGQSGRISVPLSESSAERRQLSNKSIGYNECVPTKDEVCDPCPFSDLSSPCKEIKGYDSEVCLCKRRKMPMLQYCGSLEDFIPMIPIYCPQRCQYPMYQN